jgi:hypothetical protein
MKVVMATLYVVLGYLNWKNNKKCIKNLRRVVRETIGANPNDVMRESFKVKMNQIK